MRNDSPTPNQHRVCGACGRTFPVHGRKAYCDDTCRQRGFRRRQRPADEIPLGLAVTSDNNAVTTAESGATAWVLGHPAHTATTLWP